MWNNGHLDIGNRMLRLRIRPWATIAGAGPRVVYEWEVANASLGLLSDGQENTEAEAKRAALVAARNLLVTATLGIEEAIETLDAE